ncbi:MAG: GreA/GreB family elongation factor [Candidatus Nealsonbacteria bacterium]|nr:GreA/GreB family elongation factor [Candidatus Nealsonbacteria bacterium]
MTDKQTYYLTEEGFKSIKSEYETLEKMRASKVKGEVPKIWESEDLNPDFLSFQEDMELLETRLIELENVLKNVKIIKTPSKNEKNVVQLGAVVTLQIDKSDIDELKIVGTLEANPSLGKISNESPVGKALIGRATGDEVIVSSPVKTVYKIKKIRYS